MCFVSVIFFLLLLQCNTRRSVCSGFAFSTTSNRYTILRKPSRQQHERRSKADDDVVFDEPPIDSTFGRKDFWNDFYKEKQKEQHQQQQQTNNHNQNDGFSWYATWEDLEPFVRELIPDLSSRILIPGVGNDSTIIDMCMIGGYHHLAAFDYASEGISHIQDLLAQRQQLEKEQQQYNLNLYVADARKLDKELFRDESFDAVFDKGTLDAIYLSGGKNKELGKKHLDMTISEITRVTKAGGILLSITAACVDAVKESMRNQVAWEKIQDTSQDLYITEDGFTSNNIDGTLLAWKKK